MKNELSTAGKISQCFLIAVMVSVAPTLSLAEGDWTGFYLGAQLGSTEMSNDAAGDDSDAFLGFHAGYLHETQTGYVFGGELSYDASAEFDVLGSVQKVDTTRLRFKGGHVFGRMYLYGVVGYAQMDANSGKEDGYSAGIGASYRATDKILLGAEYSRDSYDTSGGDIHSDSLALRVSYQF